MYPGVNLLPASIFKVKAILDLCPRSFLARLHEVQKSYCSHPGRTRSKCKRAIVVTPVVRVPVPVTVPVPVPVTLC